MTQMQAQTSKDVEALARSMMDQGVIALSTIRIWRAARLLKAADLGLPENSVNAQLVSLGHKKLVLKERLQELLRIESRVNAMLASVGFSFMKALHFIPIEMSNEVMEELSKHKADFAKERDVFINNYETIKQEALAKWEEEAQQFRDKGQAEVADRLLRSVEASYPPKEELHKYFEFNVVFFNVVAPPAIELDLQALAAKVKDAEVVAEARSKLVREAQADVARQMSGFGAECAQQLRERFADLLDEVHETLGTAKTRGGVSQKTLNRLHDFYDNFKKLNFAGDTGLSKVLEDFKDQWLERGAEHYREAGTASLRAAISRVGEGVRAMIEETRQASFASGSGRTVFVG